MNTKELLNHVLVEVDAARFSRPSWFNTDAGICCVADELIFEWVVQGRITCDQGDDACELLDNLIHNWPERNTVFSCYPVGGLNEYEIESGRGTIWDNPRRIELLQWLIEETK